MAKPEKTIPMQQPELVLIIDDSIAIASLLASEILPLAGYRATAALSGQEGLELAREVKPDLILCDLEMPDINGLDVLRALQNDGLDIPAIMMTAFGSEAIAAQALRMGVKDYIIKPFTTEEILAAVESALAESRLELQLREVNAALEEHQHAMAVLETIGQAVGSVLPPEALLSRIILAAVFSQGARGGFIAELDHESRLSIRTVASLPGWEGKQINVHEGSALSDALSAGRVSTHRDKIGHWCYTPLKRSDTSMGLMATVSTEGSLPEHVERFFLSLAGYAALIIENDHLRSSVAGLDLRESDP